MKAERERKPDSDTQARIRRFSGERHTGSLRSRLRAYRAAVEDTVTLSDRNQQNQRIQSKHLNKRLESAGGGRPVGVGPSLRLPP